MTKYRILKKGDFFYIQKRILFFFWTYLTVTRNIYYWGYDGLYYPTAFKTQTEAEAEMQNVIRVTKAAKEKTIIKEYK